jgi:hypothetical protein
MTNRVPCIRTTIRANREPGDYGLYVPVSLTQLTKTMHNICNVWVQTSDTEKKKSGLCIK